MRFQVTPVLSLLFLAAPSAFAQQQPTLTADPNPAPADYTVIFSATMFPPNQAINLFNNGAQIGGTSTTTDNSGSATIAVTFQNAGTFLISACYANAPLFTVICSNIVTETVKVNTVTFTSSPNPSVTGQQVTLTANMSLPDTPGALTFLDGLATIGYVDLVNGSASVTVTFNTAGIHNLSAYYGGPWPPTNALLAQTVTPGSALPTTTTLSVSPVNSNPGQPVTLTATVSPSAATGTVKFLDGTNPLANPTLRNGSAAITLLLPVGSHSLTASYSGDSNYNPSISPAVNAVVSSSPAGGQSCGTDLAAGQLATQSSTLPGSSSASAASAVDCNTDGNFFDGSVSSTNLDTNPWWEVDLGASTAVGSIAIWNRTDCCSDRLSDYWVFVSDTPFGTTDTPGTLQFRSGTWSSHQTTAPNPSTNIMAGAQGRYVRVQLTNPGYLSLAEVQVFALPPPAVTDLAQGRPASQSSTLPGVPTAAASSAVDGNTDGYFYDGSVTATNLDPNPWWQVDLGASTQIGSVKIWNRIDCCGDRLGDYWVFVSDTPFLSTDTAANLQLRVNTWASHQTTAPSPFTSIPVGAEGRYVRVQLSSANYLSLAEVQVFAPPASGTNLAVGRAASQSSTYPGAPTAGPESAVDGNTDGSFGDGSVTATNLDPNAWWQVDLGASATISSVAIWNRTDCCGSRLSDYWVFISDTPFGPTDTPTTLQFRAGTWSSHQSVAPNPSMSIIAGAQGRYVRVQLSAPGYLSLAEVQVFGTSSAPSSSDLALGRAATQSSTIPGYPSAGAASAVDGNTDGVFSDGSVTATNADPNAWWQVDLGTPSNIGTIIIWNRTDCCSSRLSDYWVFVSSSPFDASDIPATLQFRSGTWASHQTGVPNPSIIIPVAMQGRYVRVQLSGTNNLSLAEVQVMGQ